MKAPPTGSRIRGLNAFTRISDGRLPQPCSTTGRNGARPHPTTSTSARSIMGEQGMARDEIAALARVVTLAAQDGDAVAASILFRAAHELFEMASVLRERLGFAAGETVALSWSGGILAGEAGYGRCCGG